VVDIREILCPIDFSATSRHALEHAVLSARWYGARLTAVHVVHAPLFAQPPIIAVGFAEATSPALPDRRALKQELREWLLPADRAGIATDVIIDDGDAAVQILEHAGSRKADLIVMGTHGLSGFERFMLGSVAEKVLRKAKVPVMTVPPAATSAARVPYTHLLCAVDFSESSLAACRFAVSLAKEADANLTILHVLDWPPDDELLTEQLNEPEFRRLIEDRASTRLEGLLTDDIRVWCKPRTRVACGKPYQQILEAADRDRADLIVMGVRGRNALDLTLFGSTTNQVVRRAACPVLTLRQ